MGCFYEIDEILNEAVMTGIPVIIVEGVDDIAVYCDIFRSLSFPTEVYAIEHIDGYGEGCEHVIKAITELNSLDCNSEILRKNILGIIDKDVRDFRGEMPQVDHIFVLKYYSIESHFASKDSIEKVAKIALKGGSSLVNDSLCSFLKEQIDRKLLNLYYFSLEALRNAIDHSYESSFSYSCSYGKIRSSGDFIQEKANDLDIFARENLLPPTIDTIKRISKGKWIFDFFANELISIFSQLNISCRNGDIESCKSCATESFDKCLYKFREGNTYKTFKNIIISNPTGSEFEYILDRVRSMQLELFQEQSYH